MFFLSNCFKFRPEDNSEFYWALKPVLYVVLVCDILTAALNETYVFLFFILFKAGQAYLYSAFHTQRQLKSALQVKVKYKNSSKNSAVNDFFSPKASHAFSCM